MAIAFTVPIQIVFIGFMVILLVAIIIYVMIRHQRRLKLMAWLMREAIKNHDFTFHLPTRGLLSGERAMQETLNSFGEEIAKQVAMNEIESWEKLTRVLTHEIMNALTPINSISQAYLSNSAVKGTDFEEGLQAIHHTGTSLASFVDSYRKLTQLQDPSPQNLSLADFIATICPLYSNIQWTVSIPEAVVAFSDANLLRQLFINLIKNAMEAGATKIDIRWIESGIDSSIVKKTNERIKNNTGKMFRGKLLVSNNGTPVPADVRREIFVPFFTTKRRGSGIGLSLSKKIMAIQGGDIILADVPLGGYITTFIIVF